MIAEPNFIIICIMKWKTGWWFTTRVVSWLGISGSYYSFNQAANNISSNVKRKEQHWSPFGGLLFHLNRNYKYLPFDWRDKRTLLTRLYCPSTTSETSLVIAVVFCIPFSICEERGCAQVNWSLGIPLLSKPWILRRSQFLMTFFCEERRLKLTRGENFCQNSLPLSLLGCWRIFETF